MQGPRTDSIECQVEAEAVVQVELAVVSSTYLHNQGKKEEKMVDCAHANCGWCIIEGKLTRGFYS